jgi:hypothetical protein
VPARAVHLLATRLESIHDQVRWVGPGPQYDPRFGLIVDEIVPLDPRGLIVGGG